MLNESHQGFLILSFIHGLKFEAAPILENKKVILQFLLLVSLFPTFVRRFMYFGRFSKFGVLWEILCFIMKFGSGVDLSLNPYFWMYNDMVGLLLKLYVAIFFIQFKLL